MDVSCGEVEFRPLNNLWQQSSHNWRLIFSQDGPSRMIKGTAANHCLIDIRSRTFHGIAARICPLEYSEYLTAVCNVETRSILIELPRFRLSFSVCDGELELKNMPGMVIDDNQCTGAMIGLRNQLVLRHKDPKFADLPRSRFVLIPHGDVSFSISPAQNHVRVHIDTRTPFIRQVTWYKYEIDSDLGLLVGNINLTSRLYKIYLHALCSHPIPDPLTRQTGTVHALQELGNAGCFSFQKLTESDVELLRLIGDITPRRNYYPKGLQVMQTVKWSCNIPVLSQHDMFDTTVRRILQYAESLIIFNAPKVKKGRLEYKSNSDPLLMARAARRNAVYYQGGLNSHVTLGPDKSYQSRDSPHIATHDPPGLTALYTSQLIYAWPVGLTRPLTSDSELIETFVSWQSVSGLVPSASLVYNRAWLHLELSTRWLSLYNLCRQIGQSVSKKFELIFSFSALVYSEPKLQNLIPILLAVATVGAPSFIEPPTHLAYNLEDGFEPLRERVRDMVISGTCTLYNSPACLLRRELNETQEELRSRQDKYYRDNSRRKTESAVDYLMSQQHSATPQSPFYGNDDSLWFNTSEIMTDVTKYFASCSCNTDFRSFIVQVTRTLQSNHTTFPLTGDTTLTFYFTPRSDVKCYSPSEFTLENLLSARVKNAPAHSYPKFGTGAPIIHRHLGQPTNTNNLKLLISQFQCNSSSPLAQLYSERLETSRRRLHDEQTLISLKQVPAINLCLTYRDQCRSRIDSIWSTFCSALAPSTVPECILADAGLWPQLHPRVILHSLASTAKIDLALEWIESLTAYAEAFIEYQHSQRLVLYAQRSEPDNFFKELDTASFNQLDAKTNPDWLLMQVRIFFCGVLHPLYYLFSRSKGILSPERSSLMLLEK